MVANSQDQHCCGYVTVGLLYLITACLFFQVPPPIKVMSSGAYEKPARIDNVLIPVSKIPTHDPTILRTANYATGIKLQFEDA